MLRGFDFIAYKQTDQTHSLTSFMKHAQQASSNVALLLQVCAPE